MPRRPAASPARAPNSNAQTSPTGATTSRRGHRDRPGNRGHDDGATAASRPAVACRSWPSSAWWPAAPRAPARRSCSPRRNADPPSAGTVSAITLSQAGGVQAATAFSFSVQVTGFDVGSTSYRWEFGDGQASTDAAPTHTYDSAGTFSVAVTVRDARQSITSETPVTVHSITGTWIDPNASTAGVRHPATDAVGYHDHRCGFVGDRCRQPALFAVPALRLSTAGDARTHPLASATMPASAVRPLSCRWTTA